MRVKAKITLVIGIDKTVKAGQEYEIKDNEAKHLIELGFAEAVKTAQTKPSGGENNGSSSPKSDQ